MGILAALQSSFAVNLFVTCVAGFLGPALLNYVVFQSVPSYGFQAVAACLFGITWAAGAFVSYYASTSYCDHAKGSLVVKQGLRQAVVSVLVYLVVFWIPFFKHPFVDIGGDTLFSNTVAEAFFIGMTNVVLMMGNHFGSQTEGCTMSKKDADKAYKKIEADLNSREPPATPAKVKVTP